MNCRSKATLKFSNHKQAEFSYVFSSAKASLSPKIMNSHSLRTEKADTHSRD